MTNQTSMLESVKDLKVRLPMRYHVQLQSLKVLTGKNISEAVEEALAQYFRDESERKKAMIAAPVAANSTA